MRNIFVFAIVCSILLSACSTKIETVNRSLGVIEVDDSGNSVGANTEITNLKELVVQDNVGRIELDWTNSINNNILSKNIVYDKKDNCLLLTTVNNGSKYSEIFPNITSDVLKVYLDNHSNLNELAAFCQTNTPKTDIDSLIDNNNIWINYDSMDGKGILVKNETEFFVALDNDATIIIDENVTLDLSKIFEDYREWNNLVVLRDKEFMSSATREERAEMLMSLDLLMGYTTFERINIKGSEASMSSFMSEVNERILDLRRFSNLTIIGKKNSKIIGNAEVIAFSICQNITLENLSFVREQEDNRDKVMGVLLFDKCDNVVIKNCTFRNTNGSLYFRGDYTHSTHDILVENSVFDNLIDNIIEAEGLNDIVIKSCDFVNNKGVFNVRECQKVVLDDCRISNNTNTHLFKLGNEIKMTNCSVFSSKEYLDNLFEKTKFDNTSFVYTKHELINRGIGIQ